MFAPVNDAFSEPLLAVSKPSLVCLQLPMLCATVSCLPFLSLLVPHALAYLLPHQCLPLPDAVAPLCHS